MTDGMICCGWRRRSIINSEFCDRRYQSAKGTLTAVAWHLLPKSKIWTDAQQFIIQNWCGFYAEDVPVTEGLYLRRRSFDSLRAQGCRPFSTEIEPLALFPGATNPEMTSGGSDQRERDNRDRPTVTFFNVTVGLSLCHIPSCASVIMILWPYAQESSFYIYNDTFCFFSSLFCAVCPSLAEFFLWMCMMFDILFIHMCTIDCMRGAGRRV